MKVILCLFGMALECTVHLQNTIFWRAHKSEVENLGKVEQSQWLFCRRKHQCLELYASSYWYPVQIDEKRCDMHTFWLIKD